MVLEMETVKEIVQGEVKNDANNVPAKIGSTPTENHVSDTPKIPEDRDAEANEVDAGDEVRLVSSENSATGQGVKKCDMEDVMSMLGCNDGTTNSEIVADSKPQMNTDEKTATGNSDDVIVSPYVMVGRLEGAVLECGADSGTPVTASAGDQGSTQPLPESLEKNEVDTASSPLNTESETNKDANLSTGTEIVASSAFSIFSSLFCGDTSGDGNDDVANGSNNEDIEKMTPPVTVEKMEWNLEMRKLGVKKSNEVLLPPKPLDDDILGPDEESVQKKDCELSDELQLEFMCRRKIAGRVIGDCLIDGYSVHTIPCLKCGMYLMVKDGNMNCAVCPVLVKEIKESIEVNRARYYIEKKAFAKKTVTDAKSNAYKRTRRLQQLKAMEIEAKAVLFSKTAAAEVSAEESESATSGCIEAEKKLTNYMKNAEDAWSLLHTRNDEETTAINNSKLAIEKAMSDIETAVIARKTMGIQIVQDKENVRNDKITAERELTEATAMQQVTDANALAAAEAVKKALEAQAKAEEENTRAIMQIKAKEENLKVKTDKIKLVDTNCKCVIEDAEEGLKAVTDKAADIENDAANEIEEIQGLKKDASQLAKTRDEEKWITEARTIVAKQVKKMALEAKEAALKEAEEAEKTALQVSELRAGEEAKYALEADNDEAQIAAVSRYLDDTDLTYGL